MTLQLGTTDNPMLRTFTSCGRCDLICSACLVVTVRTVHNGYDTVELCQKCLEQMAATLRHFESMMQAKEDGCDEEPKE